MKQSKIIFLFTALAFSLAGCLKERDMNIDPDKGARNVIEFENTGDNVAGASSTYPRFATDLKSMQTGETVEFNVNISYSGADVAPQDITVNLEIDPAALDKFNKENGTDYVVPPTQIFSFPNTAVIKKGDRMAQIKVAVTNNSSFDFNVSYALPLKIASASIGTISSNFGKAIYSFAARNIYDGVYEVTGTLTDANGLYHGDYGDPDYPRIYELSTNTGNSVLFYDQSWDYANYLVINNTTGGAANTGIRPVITIDPATNAVTSIVNFNNGAAAVVGAGSKFNPSDRSFNVEWTFGRWHAKEHYKYIGER